MICNRRFRPTLAVAGLMLAVTACGGGDEEAAPTTVPATTTTTTTAPPTTVATTTTSTTTTTTTTTTTLPPVIRQPLTGDPVENKADIVKRPALVVKIDNAPGARRNHSGLASADIVFEEIVEAEITRFAAVFHTAGSDPVGPIRSGRSQDVDLLTSLRQPLFAWSGGNPGVTDLIANSTFVDLNHGFTPDTYYRGSGSAPHNLYSSTDRLWSWTPEGHPGAPPQQFSYLREGQQVNGTPVERADVRMRSIDVRWEWNGDDGQWMRSQEGEAHIDQTAGQIGATNVVLMVVEYRPSQIDARSPEAQTVGEGPVSVLVDGKVIEGRWQRESNDERIRLVRPNGKAIRLLPGNTWIELVEAESGSTDTDDITLTMPGG